MELELYRIDYTIVGLTSTNCLGLLPNGPKQPQKFVIGDNDGILQIISIKKDDIQLHFKTLPGKSITSVKLAGAIGTPNDKIFIASDNEVRGYTKKGKLFLTFDPGMTETINSMFVLGNDLFLCGKHIFNHYKDCKGVGSYLCGDKIVDIIAYFAQNSKRLIALIACEGRMIRCLEHARVTCSMEIDNSPTILHLYDDDSNKFVLFGTIDGRVGILDVEKTQSFDRWLIFDEKNKSSISCMDSYDLNGSGSKNLIVGRQDGNVEVYNININDHLDASVLIYVHNFNEFITSVQCGIVGCENYDEIVVCTYTGRIFGLTTHFIKDTNINNSQKINKLKSELEDLQTKVIKEREKYQNLTQSFFDELSAIPLLSVKETFILSKETSTYTLTIEVPTAIDNILLQSNVTVELLDVEKNSAVISHSETNLNENNFVLATYRCQLNTNRLELNLRTTEGQKGILQVYITPLVQPKCTRLLQYDIKSLSLHYKLHNFDGHRPFNTLTIKGPFSLAEIHSWISQCLPEIVQKPQNIEKNELWFQSAFVGSVLHCVYQKGEATFESDNVSTISILKECLTVEATKKKIRVDINIITNDESINFLLNLVESKLIYCQEFQKKILLMEALNELGVTDEEAHKYLSKKYKNLIDERKILKREGEIVFGSLNRLHGTIINLYIDYNKFKGRNVKMSIPKIKDVLENYSMQNLMELFRPTTMESNEIK